MAYLDAHVQWPSSMFNFDGRSRCSISVFNLDGQCPISMFDLDERFLNSLSGPFRRLSSIVVRVARVTILAITRRATFPQPGYLNFHY